MKKSIIVTLCNVVLMACIITCVLLFHPYSSDIEATTFNQVTSLDKLKATTDNLSQQVTTLQAHIDSYKDSLAQLNKRVTSIDENYQKLETLLVDYYIDKLKDTTYCSIYNENYIYYTAAENLGIIGKPAIPKLIEKLSTTDDYERTLALYALLLASQADNVKAFSGNDYIHTSLDFDSRNHSAQVKIAMDWWEKYNSYF